MIQKIDDSYIRQLFASEITDYYPFVEVESGIELEDVKKYNYTEIYGRMVYRINTCELRTVFDGCFTIFQEFSTIILYIKFNSFTVNKNSCKLKDDFHIFIDRLEDEYKVSVMEIGTNYDHIVKICINKKIKT